LTPIILEKSSTASSVLILLSKILLTFQISRCISAVLNVSRSIYQESAKQRFVPLNAIIQIIKLALYIVSSIIIISLIINRSPVYLLSGLGALTAVLLLVFQDTIKGLVASIQISANRMVVAGDWIELPKYGADGDVIEIGLNTVKIENFDKTITTVPTHALIDDSFKNWRNMYRTGARRIKRTIIIDIGSIGFYNADKINQLTKAQLLQSYLSDKKQELGLSEQVDNEESPHIINSRQLTNIGTFRAYITKYLHGNTCIRDDLTCMVRQLKATQTGLPLEIYCFANTTNWLEYEAIQADIFDHLFAIAPQFDLRIFQHPSGHDWHKKL
jgi:miniconductance mechanosensitive channel